MTMAVWESAQRLSASEIQHPIMIRHNTGNAIHSWSDIQRIKNDLFGEEAHAVEYYPKVSELVDDKNIYHVWILEPEYKAPFSFGYKFEVSHGA